MECLLRSIFITALFAIGGSLGGVARAEDFIGAGALVGWPEVVGATSYEVQLAPSPDFNSPRVKRQFCPTNLLCIDAAPGLYYFRWRVAGGDWSVARQAFFSPMAPKGLEPANKLLPGPSVKFSWKPVAGFEYYEIELMTPKGRSLSKHLVKNNEYTHSDFQFKEYTWSVRAVIPKNTSLDAAGRVKSYQVDRAGFVSETFRFVLRNNVVKRSPASTRKPASDARFTLVGPVGRMAVSADALRFRWMFQPRNGMPLQAGPKLHVYRRSDNGKLQPVTQIQVPRETDHSVEHGRLLGEGEYLWRLTTEEDGDLASYSSFAKFTMQVPLSEAKGAWSFWAGPEFYMLGYEGESSASRTEFSAGFAGASVGSRYYFLQHVFAQFDGRLAALMRQGENSAYTSFALGVGVKDRLTSRLPLRYEAGLKFSYDMLPEFRAIGDDTMAVLSASRFALTPEFKVFWDQKRQMQLYVGTGLLVPLSVSGPSVEGLTTVQKPMFLTFSTGLVGAWFWPWLFKAEARTLADGFADVRYGGFSLGISIGFEY